MSWLLQIDMEKLLLFTLVLTRVSGLTMTAPIYGTKDIPMQVRALLAVALAALITPSQWDVTVSCSGSVFQYLIFLGGELLIGLSLGMGIVILFSGIQLAGQLIGRVSGLMLADVFDPAVGVSVPLFSRLLFFVSMAVFVCIGGHRMVMAALLDTFQAIPPGGGGLPLSVVAALEELLTQSFSLGIRAAAPMVTAVLLSTLVLGLISRTMPQLNILAVGFGLNSMLTFGIMSLAIGGSVLVFQEQIEPALAILLDAIRSANPQAAVH